MKAVYFRVVLEDGTPTGHVGLVTYDGSKDLYLSLDEFVDPFAVEIKDADDFSFCMKVTNFGEDEIETSEYEIGEGVPDPYENNGWRKPKFPPLEDIYRSGI